MIVTLLILFAWMLSLAGWGQALLHLCRSFFGFEVIADLTLVTILGMALVATAATALNFFIPLNQTIVIITLVIGWALGAGSWRHVRVHLPVAIFVLTCMSGLAFWASSLTLTGDAGLYYLQTIKWFAEDVVPLGLAHLHGRLAFNSSWFALSAVTHFNIVPDLYVTSTLLLSICCVAVCRALGQTVFEKNHSLHNVFVFLSAASVVSVAIRPNVSSPSPDVAVFALALLLAGLSLKVYSHTAQSYTDLLWLMIVIAAFAVTIKLSAVALLFIPLATAVFGWRNHFAVDWSKLIIASLVVVTALWLPWTLRGIMLSGCLAYPSAFSCILPVQWAASERAVQDTLAIMSWARAPYSYVSPNVVMSNWNWFFPWGERNLLSPDFLICLVPLILGLSLWQLSRRQSRETFSILWFITPLTLGLVFWFFTAPDVRFGAGYLWALSLGLFSVGAYRAYQIELPSLKFKVIRALSIITCAAWLIFFASWIALLTRDEEFGMWGKYVMTPRPIPSVETKTYLTPENVYVYYPTRKGECWLSPIPCSESLIESLHVTRSGNHLLFLSDEQR